MTTLCGKGNDDDFSERENDSLKIKSLACQSNKVCVLKGKAKLSLVIELRGKFGLVA